MQPTDRTASAARPDDERLLWIRFVSGDPLTRSEGERLTRWIGAEELVDAFLDDLTTDRALRSVAALDATQERFVEDTLRRLEDELRAADAAGRRPVQRLLPQRRRGLAHRAWGPLLAAASLAFALGLAIGRSDRAPALLGDQPFVTTVADDGAAGLPSRLGRGLVEVPEGRTRLAFDSGATFDVDGPARLELVDDDELFFHDGRAQASVPANVTAFVVRTPTTRLVESGTTFELVVQAERGGETEVRLVQGELSIEPGRDGQWTGRDQRLTTDLFRVARVAPLNPEAVEAPVLFETDGELGGFLGMIVANGESVEFGDRAVFERARLRCSELFEDSPQHFQTFWSSVAPTAQSATLVLGNSEPQRLKVDELHALGDQLGIWVTTAVREGADGGSSPVDVMLEEFQFTVETERPESMRTLRLPRGAMGLDLPNRLFSDEKLDGHLILLTPDGRRKVHRFDGPEELRAQIRLQTQVLRELDFPLDAHGNEHHPGGSPFHFLHQGQPQGDALPEGTPKYVPRVERGRDEDERQPL